MPKSTTHRMEIIVPDWLLQQIKEFRWTERLASDAQAARVLLSVGLDKKRRKAA